MPPRGRDRREPPERTVVPLRGRSGGSAAGRPARSGIGGARRYTPRGRTTRETGTRDPFRPALEVLHGEPARTAAAPPRQRPVPPGRAGGSTKRTPARTPTKARPTRAVPRRPA